MKNHLAIALLIAASMLSEIAGGQTSRDSMRRITGEFLQEFADDIFLTGPKSACIDVPHALNGFEAIGLQAPLYRGGPAWHFVRSLEESALCPDSCRLKGIEGYIELEFEIDTCGRFSVTDCQYVQFANLGKYFYHTATTAERVACEKAGRQAIRQAMKGKNVWSPACDRTGARYLCHGRCFFNMPANEARYHITLEISIRPEFLPCIVTDTGERLQNVTAACHQDNQQTIVDREQLVEFEREHYGTSREVHRYLRQIRANSNL